MKKLLGSVFALMLVAGVANATFIGVNFTGNGVNNGNGNLGSGPYYGTTSLGAGDFVFGQNNWNNFVTGDGGNVKASDGITVMGTMSILWDTGLPNSTRWFPAAYDGSGGSDSPFGDPGADLTQILYNGFNNALNHGTVYFTYLGAAATYTLRIFGSGSALNIYNALDSVIATTPGSLGTAYFPGVQSVQLSLTTGQTIHFGAHGNWQSGQLPYYEWAPSMHDPSISAFQLESGEVPEPGTWMILGGSLLGLCIGGFRRFRKK